MPVKFYPEKPIDHLERYILKEDGTPLQGEIDIYRQLFEELGRSSVDWFIWHDLKLPTHSQKVNDHNKISAQVDFLILSTEGILILEVKGGPISVSENTFFYGKNFNNKIKENPFRQAEGYKYTIKDNILNNISHCFYTHAVAFPHVDHDFESRMFDSNLLWTKHRAVKYNYSLEGFINGVFKYSKEQHKKHYRTYPKLNQLEINSIRKILSPTIVDKNRYENCDTLEWLQINNLEILEGLYKNKRIMIEGPPGSGKTTIAKAFIDRQENKKGIYICWNNLLMHHTKNVFRDRVTIDNLEVTTLIRFLRSLDPQLELDQLMRVNTDEFYEIVKEVLRKLQEQRTLPSYDYMIIDEGQDVFDRGIDLIIQHNCGHNNNGLYDGTALVLYDIDQSYINGKRNVLEISELLSAYFSHFKLNETKRSAQNPDIRRLSVEIFRDPAILLQESTITSFPRIRVSRHKGLNAATRHIVHNFLNQIRDQHSSLKGGQCVLLLESSLLRDSYLDEPGMHYWLTIKDVEEVTERNVCDRSNKLMYSSILKFKGLEKENVFLVIGRPNETNRYEIYVGMTRAINNLEILIVE